MRGFRLLAVALLLVVFGLSIATAAEPSPLAGVRRVVFLGDSNTYSGMYVGYIEAYLRLKGPGLHCEFLNLGLPSETVSGLTELDRAGDSLFGGGTGRLKVERSSRTRGTPRCVPGPGGNERAKTDQY